MVDRINWSDTNYNLLDLVNNFSKSFPLFIKVPLNLNNISSEFLKLENNQNNNEQIYLIRSILLQNRILAQNENRYFLSIPKENNLKFEVYQKENKQSKPKYAIDVVKKYVLPVKATISKKSKPIKIGGVFKNTKDIGPLILLKYMTEEFLEAHKVIKDSIEKHVTILPTNMELNIKIGIGLISGDIDEWFRFNNAIRRNQQKLDTLVNDLKHLTDIYLYSSFPKDKINTEHEKISFNKSETEPLNEIISNKEIKPLDNGIHRSQSSRLPAKRENTVGRAWPRPASMVYSASLDSNNPYDIPISYGTSYLKDETETGRFVDPHLVLVRRRESQRVKRELRLKNRNSLILDTRGTTLNEKNDQDKPKNLQDHRLSLQDVRYLNPVLEKQRLYNSQLNLNSSIQNVTKSGTIYRIDQNTHPKSLQHSLYNGSITLNPILSDTNKRSTSNVQYKNNVRVSLDNRRMPDDNKLLYRDQKIYINSNIPEVANEIRKVNTAGLNPILTITREEDLDLKSEKIGKENSINNNKSSSKKENKLVNKETQAHIAYERTDKSSFQKKEIKDLENQTSIYDKKEVKSIVDFKGSEITTPNSTDPKEALEQLDMYLSEYDESSKKLNDSNSKANITTSNKPSNVIKSTRPNRNINRL